MVSGGPAAGSTPCRWRVASPHIIPQYVKSLPFRGGRTNQIPLTIKPYPMKALI